MPYMFDTMFSAEGRRAKSSSRKRFKTLKTIDSDLREVLHEDEKVYFLAKNEVNSALDNLRSSFLRVGLFALSQNRRVVLLTTERILLLRIGRKDKLTKLKSQMRYAAIQRVSSTSFANLNLVDLLVGALFVFAIFHEIDALHTRNVARQGIYPG